MPASDDPSQAWVPRPREAWVATDPSAEFYLREAIAEARAAELSGEVPVGAVIVFEGQGRESGFDMMRL